MSFIKNLTHKNKIMILAGIGICAVVLVLFMVSSVTGKESPVSFEYDSVIEANLAENVRNYLDEYLILEEHDRNIIANEAVENYRIIMLSGAENITDEHTDAINRNMLQALDSHTIDSQITYEDLEALASGISKIILDTILFQIEESGMSRLDAYKEEYVVLADSLQTQIDELKKRSTSVNITAHVKNNDAEIANAKNEIYSSVDQELSSMRRTISAISDGEDGKDGKDGRDGKDGENGKDGVNGKDGKNGTNGINGKDGKNGIDGEDGKDGANGENGKDGKDGINGENGKDGKDGTNGENGKDGADGENGRGGTDGKTTYVAYADDRYGNGFSLIPTDTTKYIGTCITTEAEQPAKAAEYNWQQYRTYIITSTTDENKTTTLYIQ